MTKTMPVLSFAKLDEGMPMPHLLDIQTRAFQSLLQPDGKGAERTDIGLERVFKDVFPIQDVNGNYSLEFVKYALGESKYSVEECIERDMTYSVPLKATLQLVVMEEVGETTKTKRHNNIMQREVYLGERPFLTPLGTFVINGAERVIVSQLHRSPGVVFEESIHPNGQRLFSARIIPFRGSWVEFTIDIHDVIYVHIDKKKKFPATALLRAFGYGTNADILKLFYATKDIDITGKLEGRAQKREVLGTLLAADVPDPENKKGEPLGKVGDELTLEKFNTFRRAGIGKVKVFAGYTSLDLRDEAQPTTTRERQGSYVLAFDVADPETGEVLAEGGRELSDTLKKKLLKAGVTKVDVLLPAGRSESPLIKNTLLKDPTHTEAEALEQIYALLRPGEAPNLETARPGAGRVVFPPHPGRPGERPDGERGDPGVLRQLAAVAVHGSDQPAGRVDAQAAPLGPGTGRTHARARRLRGARRALQPVRPDVPHRDAGGPEHRAHHEPVLLRARERPRLHRDAVPRGEERQGDRRNPLAVGLGGRGIRRGAGQRAPHRGRPFRGRAGAVPQAGRLPPAAAGTDRLHGRGARAARVDCRGADSVPRA